jgi:CubicO group peptidase (beta-lactamase class C family)
MSSNAAASIAAVEAGLLPAVLLDGARDRMALIDRLAHYRVPGLSVAVLEGGQVAWAQGYGLADAATGRPVDRFTRFQAASISKFVTTVAALRLVERGLLALDEPVNARLRSWRLPENDLTAAQPITLRLLVSHRAGTSVSGYGAGYPRTTPLPTLLQVLDGLPPAHTEPVRVVRTPDQHFEYSSGGFAILQQLIGDVTGVPFADVMHEMVLDPLGMTESTFDQQRPDLDSVAASGHRLDGQPVPGGWHLFPEQASGSLWTTPTDLLRFAFGIQAAAKGETGAILGQDTVREMLTPQGGGPTGLGLFLDGDGPARRFSHPGNNTGYHAILTAYVERGQGAAVMVNSDNGWLLQYEVVRAIADVYGWPEYLVTKTVAAVDPASFDACVGEYRWEHGVVRISRGPDGLEWDAPDLGAGRLYPSSSTKFFAVDRPAEVQFLLGAAGHAASLILRYGRLERRASRAPAGGTDAANP